MAYRSTSASFSNNEQDKARKKGLFSKVFGSGSNRQADDSYQSPPQSVRRPPPSGSSSRSEAPSSQVSSVDSHVTDRNPPHERLIEPRRSFTVQAAMQDIAQPDGISSSGSEITANQGIVNSTAASMNSAPQAPATTISVPQMSAWRRAQELTRKAEEEAMMAEKKSQEAYICATEAAAAQKEAEEAHELYDKSKAQLRVHEEEQLRAEEARELVEQSLQQLEAREAEMGLLQTDAEKAAEVARAKYDEAKAQRELAERKTAEHKQIEADHLAMQQRLQDAGDQLASMTEEMDHQAAALDQSHASRHQRAEQLAEAEEEVKRIMQQLAQAQAVVEQLKEEISSVAKAEEEQEAALAGKQEQQRMHSSFVETTKLQLTDLSQRREAAASEAQACRDAIRGKADIAKQERENALACKAAVDNALTDMEAHREEHAQKERDLQAQKQASDNAALQIPAMREEAEARAKQTNEKYDEAEQKSQAWMHAKDQAQQHKRQWHSYWQQAMHVGSDADVEANTKLKGLEEKLAAVGQNISLRVKVKEQEEYEDANGEEEQQHELDQYRGPHDNGGVMPSYESGRQQF